MIIIDDFTMLARTEPSTSKKHGIAICCAGYSVQLRKLLRIYPLTMQYQFQAWTRASVKLRKPEQDNREESWRLDGDCSCIEQLYKARPDFQFLSSIASPSIAKLNAERRSLGIINPKSVRYSFERRKNVDPYEQLTLWDRLETNGPLHKSDLIPRLEFSDEQGFHNLQLKEWGCHEFLRKHRDMADRLWSNLTLDREDYRHLLLVGNQKDRRNSWLVIKVISEKIEPVTIDLFSAAS